MDKYTLATTFRHIFLCATVVSLAACSSSNGENSSITQVGFVDIGDAMMNDTGEITMFFNVLSQPISIDALNTLRELDDEYCEITISSVNDPESVEKIAGASIGAALDAGEVITITSPLGSFAEITKLDNVDQPFYLSNSTLPAPYPSGLIVDIPGNEFPAISSLAIPDIEPFTLTSHTAGESVSLDHEFTWVAGDNPDASIRLYTNTNFSSADMTTEGIDNQEEKELEIECVLQDDGSFGFNPDDLSKLTATGLDQMNFHIGREVEALKKQGDALLFITRSSGDL